MNIFRICALALCAVVFGALVKKTNRETAVLLGVGACTVIFLEILESLGPLMEQMQSLGEISSLPGSVLPAVCRSVGIAVVGQLAACACKDAGESALAYTVELGCRAAILAAALPLFLEVLHSLETILKL